MSSIDIRSNDAKPAAGALFVIHRLVIDAKFFAKSLDNFDAKETVRRSRDKANTIFSRLVESEWRHLSMLFHTAKFISMLHCSVELDVLTLHLAGMDMRIMKEDAKRSYQEGAAASANGVRFQELIVSGPSDVFKLSAYFLSTDPATYDLEKFVFALRDASTALRVSQENDLNEEETLFDVIMRMIPDVNNREELRRLGGALVERAVALGVEQHNDDHNQPGSHKRHSFSTASSDENSDSPRSKKAREDEGRLPGPSTATGKAEIVDELEVEDAAEQVPPTFAEESTVCREEEVVVAAAPNVGTSRCEGEVVEEEQLCIGAISKSGRPKTAPNVEVIEDDGEDDAPEVTGRLFEAAVRLLEAAGRLLETEERLLKTADRDTRKEAEKKKTCDAQKR